jgi:phosphomannomutase
MSELIISISGMRGIIGENLTPFTAVEYGCAFASYLKGKINKPGSRLKVCIGMDGRPSGRMLLSAVTSGLCSCGVDVIELGIVTTPCVAVMVNELKCDGGVVITASHNPIEYNGIKLLLNNSMAPPVDEAKVIRDAYFNKAFSLTKSIDCGGVISETRTDDIHIEKVLGITDKINVGKKGYKVVLDSVNASGGRVGVKLLEKYGCDVVAINNKQTGLFTHKPEPTGENLEGLCGIVTENEADIGFAQDPDADRLAIIDENGNYIGEEYTLALAASYVLGKTDAKKAAANLSTSRMLDDVAGQFGVEVIRTPVGEANVAQAMIENGCVIGGEGNGGVIDLRVVPVRDSLVAIGHVLSLMAETGKRISELASGIKPYYMHKEKIDADSDTADKIIEKAKGVFTDARVNTSDGCRFDFESGWVHIRSSNTEPVMRIIAEGLSREQVEGYLQQISGIKAEVIQGI